MKKFKKLMLERIKWRMPGKGKSAADAEENRCDLVWQVYDVTFKKTGGGVPINFSPGYKSRSEFYRLENQTGRCGSFCARTSEKIRGRTLLGLGVEPIDSRGRRRRLINHFLTSSCLDTARTLILTCLPWKLDAFSCTL